MATTDEIVSRHPQKSKGRKRPRSWHHGPNQDRVFAEADRIFGPPASITCPHCDMTSYNPNDIAERFCGNCRIWLDDNESEKS